MDLLFLDFEKAFDKVDFFILMEKLRKLGIVGKVGSWIGSFIMGRLQALKVGDKISDWEHVISGIPQGTVMGPRGVSNTNKSGIDEQQSLSHSFRVYKLPCFFAV